MAADPAGQERDRRLRPEAYREAMETSPEGPSARPVLHRVIVNARGDLRRNRLALPADSQDSAPGDF